MTTQDANGGLSALLVDAADRGTRLDRFLSARVAGISRQRVKALILAGEVRVDGVVKTDPAYKVATNSKIDLHLPEPEPPGPVGEEIALDIVYEDAHLVVIDKPAGLVTHPAAGNETGTLVNALIAHCAGELSGIGGVRRPGIVHRLDKDTSGLLVVAKTDAAHQGLAAQFQAHGADGRLRREYLALVWGRFDRPAGLVDAPLARSTTNRRKMAIARPDTGRRAVTHYEVETVYETSGATVVARLRLALETGRTHQIRIHMASIGHPLLGDQTYGAGFRASESLLPPEAQVALAALARQALHATVLGFEHPVTGIDLSFESPLPADILAVESGLARC